MLPLFNVKSSFYCLCFVYSNHYLLAIANIHSTLFSYNFMMMWQLKNGFKYENLGTCFPEVQVVIVLEGSGRCLKRK